jgi:hypothetical protein
VKARTTSRTEVNTYTSTVIELDPQETEVLSKALASVMGATPPGAVLRIKRMTVEGAFWAKDSSYSGYQMSFDVSTSEEKP